MGMTFAEFTKGNKLRSVECFKRAVEPDSVQAFAIGAAEEVGEVMGKVRALLGYTARKVGTVTPEDLGDEVADAVHYLDLLVECYGLRMEDCLQRKFNKVSERSGSSFRFRDGRLVREEFKDVS
jgi:NTP pyrophosphatase (non-canonical NTP hydrolase)